MVLATLRRTLAEDDQRWTRIAAGIQPMKVEEGSPVNELLCGLNQSLKNEPPAWLAKRLQNKDANRFSAMEAEGWSE